MFEDSYLDSFMESYIGGWTGDEDRYFPDDDYDTFHREKQEWDEADDMMGYDDLDDDDDEWDDDGELGDRD